MMSQEKSDRRKHPRHFIRILVDYSASDTFLYDYSNDLSEGGVYIQTTTPLQKGEQLDLRFTIPGMDRLFHLKGEVMWVNQKSAEIDSEEKLGDALDDLMESATEEIQEGEDLPEGMGVRFVNITPEEQSLLREFLRKETY